MTNKKGKEVSAVWMAHIFKALIKKGKNWEWGNFFGLMELIL